MASRSVVRHLTVAAVLAISLARIVIRAAEPIRLSCEPKKETNYGALYEAPVKFMVDLDRQIVELSTP